MPSQGSDAQTCINMQETMDIHWGKHHLTYVNNLNKQISGKDLDSKSLEDVSSSVDQSSAAEVD